jgi:hypothetical protein
VSGDDPRRSRSRSYPSRRGPGRATTLVGLLALAVVGVFVLAMAAAQSRSSLAAGASDAATYTPPVLATPNVVSNAGGNGTQITVIGDDLSTGPGGTSNALWTTLLQRDLAVSVTTLASVGSGYTASPSYGASRTFGDLASQTVTGSVDVVFFGGANDAGAPTLTLIKAASEAFADAKAVAPKAEVFVVGPAWPSTDPPESVLAVRDALRSAARTSDVTFIDPIASRWLSGQKDLLSADGVTLTDKGQEIVADKMRALLEDTLS